MWRSAACDLSCMAAARHFTELDCWQLANELKLRLYGVTSRSHVKPDKDWVEDVRDAAASAPRNISEGFGRRSDPDFAHFLDIARASLNECQNHLLDAVDRGYIEQFECRELTTLSKRVIGAVAGLQRHLRGKPRARRRRA